jgi:hypothetical protein
VPRSVALFEMVLVIEALDDEHHERYWDLMCSDSDTVIWGTILADMARRVALNNGDDAGGGYVLADIRRDFDAAFAEEVA